MPEFVLRLKLLPPLYISITSLEERALSYNPTSWPTTIKDEYGNYVFPYKTYPTQNSMDFSGNLKEEGGVVLGSSFSIIELEYNTDLSLNRTSEMIADNDGFTLTVDKPEGVEILELMKNGAERVDVVLNKQLYNSNID